MLALALVTLLDPLIGCIKHLSHCPLKKVKAVRDVCRSVTAWFVHLQCQPEPCPMADFPCFRCACPSGGVYIAGGIVPRLMSRVQKKGGLLNAFLNRAGRPQFHEILKTVPLFVVTNTKVGLLGSREYALRLADRSSGNSS